MGNKASALKAHRQNKKHALKNARESSLVFGLVRRSRKAALGKAADAATLVRQAAKALDKAAQHRIVKKNTAARLKSRLAKTLKKST